MASETPPYHYNYTALENLLLKEYNPRALACELDQTMSDLVDYAGEEQTYSAILPGRHYILRRLRDIFLTMENVQP